MALRFTSTFTDGDGVVHVIEIYDADFASAPTALTEGAVPIEKITGSADETISTPRPNTERIFRVLASGTALSGLKEISGSAPDRWTALHRQSGSVEYNGSIQTENTATGLLGDLKTFQIVVKDNVQGLDEVDFVDGAGDVWTDQADLSVWIARCLEKTGRSLNLIEESEWKSAGDAGRPLAQEVDGRRWSQKNSDGEQRRAVKTGPVLDTLLRAEGLRLVQYGGAFMATWPLKHLGAATITRRTYNSAGAFVSEDLAYGVPQSLTVDALGDDWVRGSDRDEGLFAAQSVTASYHFGSFDAGTLLNGDFELWSLTDNTDPVGWTRTGGTFGTDYLRFRVPGSPSNAGGIREVTVASGSTLDQIKAACVRFWRQDVGTFASGITVKLEFAVYATSRNSVTQRIEILPFKIDASEAFYIIEYDVDATTYYFEQNSNSWQTGLSAAAQRQRMTGIDAGSTNPTSRFSIERTFEQLTLPATPGAGVGTMRLKLGGPVRVLAAATDLSTDIEVWALWDDVKVSYEEQAGGGGIAYRVIDAANPKGEDIDVSLFIGEGPAPSVPGAIYQSDGVTLGTNFQRGAAEPQMPHTQLVATEMMRYERAGRRRISFELINTEVIPTEAFDFDGERWWPVHVRTVYASPGLRPQSSIVAEQLVDADTAGTTVETGRPSGAGVLSGGSPGAVFLQVLDGAVGVLQNQGAVTTTSADINAGSQTTASIVPVNSKFASDGEVLTLVDRITHETYDLTLNGDYVPASTTLTFDAFSFPHVVASGSYLFVGAADALTKIIITREGFSAIVEARELGKVNETIAPGGQRGPTAGLLAITPLEYDVFDEQFIYVVDDGPGGTGDRYGAKLAPIKLDGAQSATSTTLAIKNAGGGNVTFNRGLQVGGTIQYVYQRDLTPTALNVFFNGIQVQAKIFKTTSWDGVADANGVITTPGTQGWALTGVAGQPGDADITGTLHFGGGLTGGGGRAGNDGLALEAEGGIGTENAANVIQFIEAAGGTKTFVIGSTNDPGSQGSFLLPGNDVTPAFKQNWIKAAGSGGTQVYGGTYFDVGLTTEGLRLQNYMTLHAIAAPGASGAADMGRLYMLAADDGLWWHPNGGSAVDLTASGNTPIASRVIPTGTGADIEDSAGPWFITSAGRLSNVATPPSDAHIWVDTSETDTTIAGIRIQQASTGDALLTFKLAGGRGYALGIDNSDADKLKIGTVAGGSPGVASNVLAVFEPTIGLTVTDDVVATGNMQALQGTFTTGRVYGETVSQYLSLTTTESAVYHGTSVVLVDATKAQVHVGGTVSLHATGDALAPRLGIGIETPQQMLHVKSIANGADVFLLLEGRDAGTTDRTGLLGFDPDANAVFLQNGALPYRLSLSSLGTTTTPGPLRLDLASNADYVWTNRTNNLTLRNLDGVTRLSLFDNAGTGAADVSMRLYGVGTFSDVTNFERLEVVASSLGAKPFEIISEAGGTGTERDIKIYTASNNNQLRLLASGNVAVNSATAAYQLYVNGTLGVGATLTAGPGSSIAGQLNITLDGGQAVVYLDEMVGGPAAVSQGTFIFTQTDNRLYYQNGSPATVHLIWTDQDFVAGDLVTAGSPFGTDNRALRSDGTGRLSQSSAVSIDDSGNVSTSGTLTGGDGSTINGQLNVTTQVYLTELASDPAAVNQGTFVYTKTDNRLYFQNGSPATVHQILTDNDVLGDVVGPAGATDNAVARFDLATGKLIQNSLVTISDTGSMIVKGQITVDLDGGQAALFLDEMVGGPAAVSQGTFIFTQTDNRLYYQNGNPATVHLIWTDQDFNATNVVTSTSAFGIDNRILRSDGTGRLSQSSAVSIDDSGNVSTSGTLTGGDGSTINGQLNVTTQVYLTELVSDPAATSQGTFVYTKTDNRLYFQNGSPATVHQIFTDNDLLLPVVFQDKVTAQALDVQDTTTAAIDIIRNDTSIVDADLLGRLSFIGNDPAGAVGARIQAVANETWSTGINGTTVSFFACEQGSSTLREHLRIYDGRVSTLILQGEPTGDTTNFPEIGTSQFYVIGGNSFRVKVRTGTSTYLTLTIGTLS